MYAPQGPPAVYSSVLTSSVIIMAANGNRALALCVIGGMSVGTLSLLFVVPAFYIIFQKLHDKFQGSTVEVANKE